MSASKVQNDRSGGADSLDSWMFQRFEVDGKKLDLALDPDFKSVISATILGGFVAGGTIYNNVDGTFNIIWDDDRGVDETNSEDVVEFKYMTSAGERTVWYYCISGGGAHLTAETVSLQRFLEPDLLGNLYQRGIGVSVNINIEAWSTNRAYIFLKDNKEKNNEWYKLAKIHRSKTPPILNVYIGSDSMRPIVSGPYRL